MPHFLLTGCRDLGMENWPTSLTDPMTLQEGKRAIAHVPYRTME